MILYLSLSLRLCWYAGRLMCAAYQQTDHQGLHPVTGATGLLSLATLQRRKIKQGWSSIKNERCWVTGKSILQQL